MRNVGSERRFLPEGAYDFYVRDSRDGETWGPFDTVGAARKKLVEARSTVRFSWQRSHYLIIWTINEKKVLRMLKEARMAKATAPKGERT